MKFTKGNQSDFFTGLKKETDAYFKAGNKDMYADTGIILKAIFLVGVHIAAYACLFIEGISYETYFGIYAFMGITSVLIVFNLMHDASHQSFSKNRRINNMLRYAGDLVGINSYIWNIRHNIQHHTFTNVHGGDLIIENIPVLRFSPFQEYGSFHKYQVFYAPFIYLLYTLYWSLVLDLRLFFKKDLCHMKNIVHPVSEWVVLFSSKAFYLFYIIGAPLLFTSLTFGEVVGLFLCMHLVSGVIASVVAALGHYVEGPLFLDAPDQKIDNSWAEHGLEATIDFSPNSKFAHWFTGGLNTHTAHHLFPNISHAHYYELTKIIREYCKTNGYPYKSETLGGALLSHYRYMKRLSRSEQKLAIC